MHEGTKFSATILCIVIGLESLASEAGNLQQSLLIGSLQATTAPKVSTEFQAEVARLARDGLTLKEAFEANLDGSAHHLAAIFQRAKSKPEEAMGAYEFRIIESDGRSAKTIFRRPEFSFSFPRILLRPNGSDINGDGLKEVIVESSSGGNCWACNPTEIYQLRNHKVELIAAGVILKIEDLNGDEVMDLVVTDARWEFYDDFSHAQSPSSIMIYTWKNGRYVYASRDFKVYYEKRIGELRAGIEEAKSQTSADFDESYVSLAIEFGITYAHMGELERGLKEMEKLLASNARSAAQSKHRAAIVDDFRNGDSFKKLREMKYGDPMPLN